MSDTIKSLIIDGAFLLLYPKYYFFVLILFNTGKDLCKPSEIFINTDLDVQPCLDQLGYFHF